MTKPIALNKGGLTEDQVDQYWRDGFIFPIEIFPVGEAADFRAELEQIENDWREADLPHPLLQYKRINSNCVMPMAARLANGLHPVSNPVITRDGNIVTTISGTRTLWS